MRSIARMQAAAAGGRAMFTALLAAAATFAAGFGQAAPGPALADPPLDAPIATAATGTVDALTGAAVTLAAGRTPTQFGVTGTGAASYRIPLWTPPGVGGAAPELALVYNSRAGNGTLGHGWSLEGLSTITRCNRTIAQDGAAAGVTNTLADRFCLDGQSLKLVSGTYGADGSVYATEIDGFARIVATGIAGNGPLSFTVTSRDGQVREYGATADSRIHAGNTATVRTWALSRSRDRAGPTGTGNSIVFSWRNDAAAGAYGDGSFRIASIDYPYTATGAGPFYTVSFQYSARPASDVPAGFVTGTPVREPNKLDSITIQGAGAAVPIKTYKLAYSSGPASGRLRLVGVQECGASACLPTTTIGYQDGTNGWQSWQEMGASASPNRSPLPIDLTGDGYTDLVYAVDAGSGSVRWRILVASPTGYQAPLDTGLITSASRLIPGQFLGDGRSQFLVQQNGVWQIAGFRGGTFYVASTGLTAGGEYGAADLDGDGLSDLMSQTASFTPTIMARRNVTVPGSSTATAQFAGTTQTVWTVPRTSTSWDNLLVADFNGDGRADIVALSFIRSERNPKFFGTPLLSNGFGAAYTVGTDAQLVQESMTTMGDWNADGCSDLIQLRTVFLSNCAGAWVEVPTNAGPATGATLYTVMPADWNGDGRTDLMYVDANSKDWMVIASTGTGAAPAVSTGIKAASQTEWWVHDADGDGLVDLGLRDGASGNKLRYRLRAAPGVEYDLATSFTDGFGMTQRPVYVSMARSGHTPGTNAPYPEVDLQAPLYVVREFSASDGTGGTYRNVFDYQGARRNLHGRGFQGFQAVRWQDTRTGLFTRESYAVTFPFTGRQTQRSVLQSDGSTSVSQVTSTMARSVTGGTGFEQRVFPYVSATVVREHEFGGTANGVLTRETTTSYQYGDGFGNPTQVLSTVTDRDPASPFLGSSWHTSATYSYTNDTATNWCLGLPASATITKTAAGQAAMTRTTTYTGDTRACRVTGQVHEPASPSLRVASTLGYDACGNVNTLRVVGSNPNGTSMPARTATFDHGPRCQLPERITNALGEALVYTHRYDFGVPTSVTDPNGLRTSWTHDEFGRRIQEVRPDQTRTAWSFESCSAGPCWGATDLRFVVYESHLGSDGAVFRSRQSFYDGFERPRLEQAHRALGTWTQRQTRYDSLGRPVAVDRPWSATANGFQSRTFDPLGRLVAERDQDAAGAVVATRTFSYAGRTTTAIDPLGRIRTAVHDVEGRLRRVTDPAPGGTTRYDYDSHGNLNRLQDALGAVSSGTFNVHGSRLQWSDAAAGPWSYSWNSLQELVGWTDAKGQAFAVAYDVLGRRVSRTEPEGTSTWTWGSSPALRNVGRLQSMTGLGYGEAYEYDPVGRLSSRSITSDQTYRYDYGYNSIGAVDTVAYPFSPVPTGQSGARFTVRYGYSFGEVARIDDVTIAAQPRTVWLLTANNDDRQPTGETVGAGAITLANAFDPPTGRLLARQAGATGSPAGRQNLAYQWDAAGNLTQRRDILQNLTEAFAVDALDRVTGSTLNGTVNLAVTYDATGNIRSKSDVGTYAYTHPAKPHAVTGAGSATLGYDANGNVVTRNGLSQEWASFNLPTLVQTNGQQSRFFYGPDHQRWRQVATYANGTETTHYVGGLLEKTTTSSTGLTYWRHYVPTPGNATVLVSRNSDGSASTHLLLSDHLGSTDTVLDSTGALTSRQSHAPFGARRGSNGSAASSPDWTSIGNTSRQGFTGHEMLDNVGLVHMGGRVYDPTLGRFLSADPLLASLGDSQSVNPYAYVGNRPLRATDPTGLVVDGPCLGICISIASSLIKTVVGLIGVDWNVYRPSATAIPRQSAQSGMGLCSPGLFADPCSGAIVNYSAGAGLGEGGPGTSTWSNEPTADPYAAENLQILFEDLGINAIDVLVLSPLRDAQEAYEAARRGEYVEASVQAALTACEVGKICDAVLRPMKGVIRIVKHAGGAPNGTVVIGETMKRVEEAARRIPESKTLDDMPDFRKRGGRPDQVTAEMMRYNRKWILEQLRGSKTIVDIGRDPNRSSPSIFYEMEQNMINNYSKIHPEVRIEKP
jgi:RHS repeat-associated protein